MKLRISASALKNYSECKEKFRLSRLYRVAEGKLPIWIRNGLKAHEMMAGGNSSKASQEVLSLVKHLKDMEEALGFDIRHREVEQQFTLPSGVDVLRYIDGVGYDRDGKPIMVDYKTVRTPSPWQGDVPAGWTPVKDMPPAQARGWQSAVYLLTPPDELVRELGLAEWPDTIYFLVVSADKMIGAHAVTKDGMRERELLDTIEDVNNLYTKHGFDYAPRNFGVHCNYCDFLEMCYNVPGSEDKFEKKGGKHDKESVDN